MWHRRSRRRLGLVTEHRRALLRNLVIGLVENSRIRTTYPRAKEAGKFAEKMVTIAKRGGLHSRRVLISKLSSPPTAKKLMEEIAPLFKEQNGGYTRVLRHNFRPGDGAQMALLEFTKVIEKPAEEAKEKKFKKKKGEKSEAEKVAKPEKPKKAPKQEKVSKKESAAEKKPSEPAEEKKEQGQEEPKKGGFLGNLRKFLTGD